VSIAVALDTLGEAIEATMGWCYLVTTSEALQSRVVAVQPVVGDDGLLEFGVSARNAANVIARSGVSLVFPPRSLEGMSLIVDGEASVEGEILSVRPTWAVFHRSAVSPPAE
jgi:hypothetical protein